MKYVLESDEINRLGVIFSALQFLFRFLSYSAADAGAEFSSCVSVT